MSSYEKDIFGSSSRLMLDKSSLSLNSKNNTPNKNLPNSPPNSGKNVTPKISNAENNIDISLDTKQGVALIDFLKTNSKYFVFARNKCSINNLPRGVMIKYMKNGTKKISTGYVYSTNIDANSITLLSIPDGLKQFCWSQGVENIAWITTLEWDYKKPNQYPNYMGNTSKYEPNNNDTQNNINGGKSVEKSNIDPQALSRNLLILKEEMAKIYKCIDDLNSRMIKIEKNNLIIHEEITQISNIQNNRFEKIKETFEVSRKDGIELRKNINKITEQILIR